MRYDAGEISVCDVTEMTCCLSREGMVWYGAVMPSSLTRSTGQIIQEQTDLSWSLHTPYRLLLFPSGDQTRTQSIQLLCTLCSQQQTQQQQLTDRQIEDDESLSHARNATREPESPSPLRLYAPSSQAALLYCDRASCIYDGNSPTPKTRRKLNRLTIREKP